MSLIVNLSNSGVTDQAIALFTLGGANQTKFITANKVFQDLTYQSIYFIDPTTGLTTLPSGMSFYNGIVYVNIPIPVGSSQAQIIDEANKNFAALNYNTHLGLYISTGLPTNNTAVQLYENGSNNWVSISWGASFSPITFQFLLTQAPGGTFNTQNPFVQSLSPLPITEMLNSLVGYTYMVTSLYLWSQQLDQLTTPYYYGSKQPNGDKYLIPFAPVVDPYQPNTIALETNEIDTFMIDSEAVLAFDLLAGSAISLEFEFVQIGSTELMQGALQGNLQKQYAKIEAKDKQKAEEFQRLYLLQ